MPCRSRNRGNIEQVGSPLELYRSPRNLFVAGFIGSPKMNLIGGEAARVHDAATIGVRPEHISLSADDGAWSGTVHVSEHLGADTFLHVVVDGIGTLTVRAGGEYPVKYGDRVGLTPQPGKIHRFDAGGMAI